MLDDTRTASIEAAIHAQEAAGQPWTNQSIYTVVGGNYAELSQYLKARRAHIRRPDQGGGAPAALAEEAIAAAEPGTLHEELQAAQDAEQFAEARLSLLEAKATREMLGSRRSRDGAPRAPLRQPRECDHARATRDRSPERGGGHRGLRAGLAADGGGQARPLSALCRGGTGPVAEYAGDCGAA